MTIAKRGILFRLVYPFLQRLFFALPPPKQTARTRVSILYKPDAIGDFVLASGAIRRILNLPGEWRLIVSPSVLPLAELIFPHTNILSLEGSNTRTYSPMNLTSFRQVRALSGGLLVERLVSLKHTLTGIDHCIINWLRPREFFAISGSPLLHQDWLNIWRYPFTHTAPYPTTFTGIPLELKAHQLILGMLDPHHSDSSDLLPQLPPISSNPPQEDYLLVFPSTRSTLRNYPCNLLSDAISAANLPHNPRILFSGAPEEKDAALMLAKRLGLPESSWINTPSISDALALIQGARCVLAMESAPAHLALASGKHGVFLLGGGHHGFFAPWSRNEGQHWLSVRTPCYGCNWQCHLPSPICLTSISVESISESLRSAWCAPLEA